MPEKSSRSAESGKFVSAEEAAANPETTVTETLRPHLTKKDIARTAYNVNRAYCESLGDHSFGSWEEAPDWQKNSCQLGVDFHIGNPGATAAASHEAWLALKTEEGWKYGYKKDPEKKEHPCMVHFDELPANQQCKDYLFKAVVDSLRHLL